MRAMSYPSSFNGQIQHLMWALVFLGLVMPGNAGRFRTALYLLIFGAVCITWRFHLWPNAIGGVGLAWPTSTAVHAADPGG